MTVATFVSGLVGPEAPVAVRAYDGSELDPPEAKVRVTVRSPDALRRLLAAPGELGLARAYVAGDLDLDGDIYEAVALQEQLETIKVRPAQIAELLGLVGIAGLPPLRPPPEEARLHGRRHSKARDAAAVAYHYDVSNDFYRIVLGPSLTYSCAVWTDTTATLEEAQAAKHELVCQKLALEPGMRLLDVGCGWGSMLLHAAQHHGVRGVGVTLSHRQAELAAQRVRDAGLADRIEIRYQDYRDVDDGPYEAISSIGMFEHVGLAQLAVYFEACEALLAPGGRFLNHGITKPGRGGKPRRDGRLEPRVGRRRLEPEFFARYVFPDGELHEVGAVVSAMQHAGFEVRHVESLRDHYALTLRRWVRNLEAGWDDAVREAGDARARVWHLYMAGAGRWFELGRNEIHQVLATKLFDRSGGYPLRPAFG